MKRVKTKATKKEDLVEEYLKAPKPTITKSWTKSEEEALLALKNPKVNLKETALGRATVQMARAVGNNLSNLSSPDRNNLRLALQKFDESIKSNIPTGKL